MDREGGLALVEIERLTESRKAEDMVAVAVRNEDLGDRKARPEAHHLALGALAGVEQQPLALAIDADGTRVALGGRYRAAGPEEGHAQRH
jgi:light-regulated signal transduction histidine kinase (bacteriophytochrome)